MLGCLFGTVMSSVLRSVTVGIGLITYEDNVEAPRRRPRVELQALSKNLEDTVELA